LYDATSARELQRAQAIFDELKPLPEFIVAGGRRTTALQKLLTDARSQHRARHRFRPLLA
jgi:hypothetical protein